MSEQIMWVVKDEKGKFEMRTLRRTRKDSIRMCVMNDVYPKWRHLYGWGYRCVRVRITEVQS